MSSLQGPMPGLARPPGLPAVSYAPRSWALTLGAVIVGLVLLGGLIWLIVYLTRSTGGGGGGGGASIPYPQWNPGNATNAPVTIRNPAGSYFMYADKGTLRLTRAFGDGWVWRLRDSDGKFIIQLEGNTPGFVNVSSRGAVTVSSHESKGTPFRGYVADETKQEIIFATDASKPLYLTSSGSNSAIGTTSNYQRALRFTISSAAPVRGVSAATAAGGAAALVAAPAPAPVPAAPAPTAVAPPPEVVAAGRYAVLRPIPASGAVFPPADYYG